MSARHDYPVHPESLRRELNRRFTLSLVKGGFAPIIIILIITFSFVLFYIVAWAPWVSLDFARQKALGSLDKSCRELTNYEYTDNAPSEMRSLTFSEQLGLAPPFGKNQTLYILCGNTSYKNIYFVSFLGTLKLKESKPIPHRVSVEQPQNTIEKINETANLELIGANWKTYTNTKYYYTFKFPEYLEYGGKPANDTDKLTITNGENDSYKFSEDKFVGFRVWVIHSEKSLEDYLNEEYPKNQAGIPAFETGLQNGKITKITIDNVSGFKAPNGMQFENTERTAWVEKNNLIYKFTTFGNGETGSSYIQKAGVIFNQILSTFKFLD